MGEPKSYLLKSVHFTETDPVIGRIVAVERLVKRSQTLGDVLQPSRNLEYKTEMVRGRVVGGTTNVYQYIMPPQWPWQKPTTREHIDTIYSVQFQDGSFQRVPEEELIFVYDGYVWADSSAPSAASSEPSPTGTKVEVKSDPEPKKQGRPANRKS